MEALIDQDPEEHLSLPDKYLFNSPRIFLNKTTPA